MWGDLDLLLDVGAAGDLNLGGENLLLLLCGETDLLVDGELLLSRDTGLLLEYLSNIGDLLRLGDLDLELAMSEDLDKLRLELLGDLLLLVVGGKDLFG